MELTTIVHGAGEAEKAREASKALFYGEDTDTGGVPTGTVKGSELEAGVELLELLVRSGLCASRGEARRLITQGGAYLNEEKVEPGAVEFLVREEHFPGGELRLRAGKKRHYRFRVQ